MQRLESPVAIHPRHIRGLGSEPAVEPFERPGGVTQGEIRERHVVLPDVVRPRGASAAESSRRAAAASPARANASARMSMSSGVVGGLAFSTATASAARPLRISR